MFRYCPSCASEHIRFEDRRVFRCPDCGFTYYHNIAAAVGAILLAGEAVMFLVRANEPAKGKLDLPGGFVDPGEGAAEALRRECREEIGWDPGEHFAFLASFPNIYPYKNIPYHTCDLFFTLRVPGLRREDLHPDPAEVGDIRFIDPRTLDLKDLAFDSTRRAIRAFVDAAHAP